MSFVIHNIDIKKPKTYKQLSFIQTLLLENKKTKMKELSNIFRFQQIPKTKFIESTFKTKKIGTDIIIKYGLLKPEYEHLYNGIRGKGFLNFFKYRSINLYCHFKSYVKSILSKILNDYNNITKETLNRYGDMKIEHLMIYRTPINSMIDNALNIFSFGKYAEMKKKYGFEHFFHLSLVAKVQGIDIIIEKNEVINVSTSYNTIHKTETKNVFLKDKTLTINQLLNTTQKKQKKKIYFSYDAFNNNCQTFIRALLTNVDLYTHDIDTFIFQNVENLIKEMPTLSKITKIITDFGVWFNKITGQKNQIFIITLFFYFFYFL